MHLKNMCVFFVILAFCKKVQLEPKYSVFEIFRNRSVHIFWKPNFFKNRRIEESNAHPETARARGSGRVPALAGGELAIEPERTGAAPIDARETNSAAST